MSYQPIENYGIIGNMHTTALVGINGSIDWFCFPRFDSPSVFAALLDDKKGGYFRISPDCEVPTTRQFYWPDTNVLITRFLSSHGVAEIQDFMPVGQDLPTHWHHQVVRRVKVVRGSVPFLMECKPAFDYARAPHEVYRTPQGIRFASKDLAFDVITDTPVELADGAACARFTLKQGEGAIFILRGLNVESECVNCPTTEESEDLFECTVRYWRKWISQCTYKGRWREAVYRSALVLKLLTYEPTGAIVAAPTCSLPESIGGVRNWDYRFSWIRDAAFTVYGLMRIGFTGEAKAFIHWLEARCKEMEGASEPLQIVYGIDGKHNLQEEVLSHLDGYRGSKPVRIGNGAYTQLQLDIYGELLDSVYLYCKFGNSIPYDTWVHLRRLLNWLCENWQRTDEGIWEIRSTRQHFTHSKLMCWVALDRGIRLAEMLSFPADRAKWYAVRDTIYEELIDKGWSPRKETFTQRYESDELDASSLIMPLVSFLSPNDPRMLKTLAAINRPPAEGGLVTDGLVYRYDSDRGLDGIVGDEGTFNMCSFWLVEALTQAGKEDPRKLEEARLLLEKMMGYGNHLGLYAEQTGVTGEALGNFPQAFTHMALINAAFQVDRALGSNGF